MKAISLHEVQKPHAGVYYSIILIVPFQSSVVGGPIDPQRIGPVSRRYDDIVGAGIIDRDAVEYLRVGPAETELLGWIGADRALGRPPVHLLGKLIKYSIYLE